MNPTIELPDPRNADILVHVGGRLVPRKDASVSVFDSVVQGGDAVWEGLRLYEGRIAELDAHLDRLFERFELGAPTGKLARVSGGCHPVGRQGNRLQPFFQRRPDQVGQRLGDGDRGFRLTGAGLAGYREGKTPVDCADKRHDGGRDASRSLAVVFLWRLLGSVWRHPERLARVMAE